MFTKKCPRCNKIQIYKNKRGFENAVKANSICYSCSFSEKNKGKKLTEEHKKNIGLANKGEKNGFYGKKHSTEVKIKLKKNRTGVHHSQESKLLISKATSGENNPMYGRSIYDIWLEKFGKEEADKRLSNFKEKLSKATSGENNPMYGKPSSQGSGNG